MGLYVARALFILIVTMASLLLIVGGWYLIWEATT